MKSFGASQSTVRKLRIQLYCREQRNVRFGWDPGHAEQAQGIRLQLREQRNVRFGWDPGHAEQAQGIRLQLWLCK